jgi:hypothetical protein
VVECRRIDEVASKPTPQDEMRHGLTYFHARIFKQLPCSHAASTIHKLPAPPPPSTTLSHKFGSWMQGEFLRREPQRFRLLPRRRARRRNLVASLGVKFFEMVQALMFDLSMWRCSGAAGARGCDLGKERLLDGAAIAEERKRRNCPDPGTSSATGSPTEAARNKDRQLCHGR